MNRGRHYVQFYKSDEALLVSNLADYVREGVRRGSGILIIASHDHRRDLARVLHDHDIRLSALEVSGQAQLLDAEATLTTITCGDQIDPHRFRSFVGATVERMSSAFPSDPLRVYGEVVDLLWARGDCAGAVQLETLWNALLVTQKFDLFCAYGIDIFGAEFQPATVDALLCTHSSFLPSANGYLLGRAIARAMDEVLGPRVRELRRSIKLEFEPLWPSIPTPEATILWLRRHLPAQSEDLVRRAREYYLTA